MARRPEIFLQWDFDHGETLGNTVRRVVDEINSVYSQISDLSNDEISVGTVYKPIEIGLYRHLVALRNIHFLHILSSSHMNTPNSSDFLSDQILHSVLYSSLNRWDVFQTLLKFNEKYRSSKSTLRRWISKLLKLGSRFGNKSFDDQSAEFNRLEFIIEDVQRTLHLNRRLRHPLIALSRNETNGICSTFLQRFEQNDYAYLVLLDPDTFNHVISTAHNPETRKKVFLTYYRETDDMIFVKKLLQAEQDYAKRLGYENSAQMLFSSNYLKESSMTRLYTHLSSRLGNALKQKKKDWLAQKRRQCGRFGYKFNEELNLWDIDYCQRTSEPVSYDELSLKLSEYFPLKHVLSQLLSMYDNFLGLKTLIACDFPTWNHNVLAFSVCNATPENELLGFICFDLLSRREKRNCPPYCYVLQPGFTSLLHKRREKLTVAAVVASFDLSTSTATRSDMVLLSHKDTANLCRNIGSAYQAVCNRPPYTFYNTIVMEKDILGVMDKFWDNFGWEPEILRFISCHHKSDKPIPDDLLANLCKVRYDKDIFKTAVSVYNGIIDLKLRQEADDLEFSKQVFYEHIFGLEYSKYLDFTTDNFSLISLPFSRLYYCNLLCQIIADDLFQSLFKNSRSSPEIGLEFRKKILEPFGSVNPKDMFTSFLGRKPNHKAFLQLRNL